jgi:hypothetical protein
MKTATIALLAASAIALAACSAAKEPDQPPAETNLVDVTEPQNYANVATEAPPATRIDNTAAAAEAPPPPTLSADEQTQEDADATGMTAKVNRDESGNAAQPAR